MTYPHIQHLCNIAKRQHVLWVGHNHHNVRHTVMAIRNLNIEGAKVWITNGEERVEFTEGGTIMLTSRRSIQAVRGRTFDHVFTDSHQYLDDERFRAEVGPCFTQGERYSVIG